MTGLSALRSGSAELPLQPGVVHFGEGLARHRFGHMMTRELYAYPNRAPAKRWTPEQLGHELWDSVDWAFRDEAHTEHSDAFLLVNRDQALVNFDLAMQYFASLDDAGFNEALDRVLAKGRTFKPVADLRDWDRVEGVYIMVFDGIHQFYIGQSADIRRRVKAHWTGRKPFDRVVFGSHYESVFPVDELRALDTTRIYAARSRNPAGLEERVEKAADQRYSLNRVPGGEPHALAFLLEGIRNKAYGAKATASTADAVDEADRHVMAMIANDSGDSLVARLATLDLSIHSFEGPDGASGLWSRRDGIRDAAARGDLAVSDFARFLEAIGETVICPAG